LSGKVENGKEHSEKRILTELEEAGLVKYLVDSNLARDGKNMTEIAAKVRILGICRVCSFGGNHRPSPIIWDHAGV
jgi:hypothetical protein